MIHVSLFIIPPCTSFLPSHRNLLAILCVSVHERFWLNTISSSIVSPKETLYAVQIFFSEMQINVYYFVNIILQDAVHSIKSIKSPRHQNVNNR